MKIRMSRAQFQRLADIAIQHGWELRAEALESHSPRVQANLEKRANEAMSLGDALYAQLRD